MNVIIAKAGLGIAMGLCVLLSLFLMRRDYGLFSKPRLLVFVWAALRLVPFIVVYILLGYEPQSDINGFSLIAESAKAGGVVYRDFVCTYSPLYPYLLALSISLWSSTKAMVLLMIVMEGVALLVSWFLFRGTLSDRELTQKYWLYLLLPAPLVLCVLGTQEDVWIWLFVALAAIGWRKRQSYGLYGSLLLLGMLTTKAIFVLILPALLLLSRDFRRLGAVLAIGGGLVLAFLYYLVGLEFMQPVHEADILRAPNILSVINPWLFNGIGLGEKLWNWVGLLISIGTSCFAAFRLRHLPFVKVLSRVFVITYATMMIVQQSAYSNYIFIFAIPLVFEIIDWSQLKQVMLFLIYNVLCLVHPSYWWREGRPIYESPADIFNSSATITDYMMQLGIVMLTVYFIWLSFNKQKHHELRSALKS